MEEIVRRLRLLEERCNAIRKKSQFEEQAMLKGSREIFNEINALNKRLSDMRVGISEIADKLEKMREEMDQSVSRSEFNVIVKYLNFWQPLDYLTRKEAEKMLDNALGMKNRKE